MANNASMIVYLADDGSLHGEVYRNGNRHKIELPEGRELSAIREELFMQKHLADARKAREDEQHETEAAARHKRIWRDAVASHGVAFANRTIGGQHKITRSDVRPMSNRELEAFLAKE